MTTAGQKRSRQTADIYPPLSAPNTSPSYTSAPHHKSSSRNASHINATSASSFRNVSACNRCRVRKNRCDQNLPACSACEKAGVKCVGFDPITKREIPRTYVYYLESRMNYLEELLESNGIAYEPCTDFDLGSKPISDQSNTTLRHSPGSDRDPTIKRERSDVGNGSESGSEWEAKHEESENINKLVSNIGMVSVQGASDPRYLGSTSGISFARVVAAAIKSAVPGKSGRNSKAGSFGTAAGAAGPTSMRESFFGLTSKPSIKPAPFPDKDLGMKLVELYFEYANPQIPILHRGDFMTLFNRAYQSKDRQRSPRELYMLNIVFAIGAGIILEDSSSAKSSPEQARNTTFKNDPESPSFKKQKLSSFQRQPEEYHASAMVHLETFLGSMPTTDRPEGFGGGLEQLQAVLLLAGFALLRPVAPGLWYITGVAVRLGVDLGLHYEDGAVLDDSSAQEQDLNPNAKGIDARERGRREWVRDLRRRLWWSVYSFDRLVSTCVGRPFGVTDQVITTDWPSVLDDKDITPEGFLIHSHNFNGPSYKRVAHHYFRLRLLQSEILQVLQYRQAQRVHGMDREKSNQYMHTTLSSSFLQPFRGSFHAWRKDIDGRLWEWKESAPLQQDTTVRFNNKFLELNYWQAVIMLYRQSLSTPQRFAGEVGPHTEVESPLSPHIEDHESDDEIYLKVAEAGQRVLKLYRQLHKKHVVNYTYLATVHLFMAGAYRATPIFLRLTRTGIAFLFSVWHSAAVRSRLVRLCCWLLHPDVADDIQNMTDVNYTVLAGTTVLTDLIDKCPPAEACRDAFDRMSKATIAMCHSTTGFGSQLKFSRQVQDESPVSTNSPQFPPQQAYLGSRPPPSFDYNLKDLFSDHSIPASMTFRSGSGWQFPSNQPAPFSYPSPSVSTNSISTANVAQMHPQYDPRLFSQQANTQANLTNAADLSSSVTSNTSSSGYDYSNLDIMQMPDFDFLSHEDHSVGNTNAPYTNLGFEGGQHDFDDGSPGMPDLFGGFFFGGPQQSDTDLESIGLNMDQSSFPDVGMAERMQTWPQGPGG
ncbi:uncharacterized protein KY384_007054 [Bacidia gigantensis]|uniref:uncharacterized protein n=1 Tax=Bacidia gigantensis TaxID=2732470 RepID=UPI001D03961A|nr:uncharacterized protein KY384_007054 [Bacidia gigantensis]KAG8528138.1 hypothetical protein KY384_007054 [Bacidia gigantensis]